MLGKSKPIDDTKFIYANWAISHGLASEKRLGYQEICKFAISLHFRIIAGYHTSKDLAYIRRCIIGNLGNLIPLHCFGTLNSFSISRPFTTILHRDAMSLSSTSSQPIQTISYAQLCSDIQLKFIDASEFRLHCEVHIIS